MAVSRLKAYEDALDRCLDQLSRIPPGVTSATIGGVVVSIGGIEEQITFYERKIAELKGDRPNWQTVDLSGA